MISILLLFFVVLVFQTIGFIVIVLSLIDLDSFVLLGCLRYKVDFQCMQLDDIENDFDFDDY